MTQQYKALAIKYRPQTIKDLKGQDVLVQTLQNAFNLNRISHAFILTGVRGVGKTTTARIIAKALNCIGEDGNGPITLNPCGICEQCVSINNDKNLDVLEMDAASKTGIDDIREVIESVKYKPISARYKVYIIDEIHMLSKSAFNALLKTLEEPPLYVKFIFATTEIKKVPVTIISRCQRFDLKRLEIDELYNHLANICKKENVSFEPLGLSLIVKASDGSVRDSLSLLDQAINHTDSNISEAEIINMLGLSNKNDLLNLFEKIVMADSEKALSIINDQYKKGNDLVSMFEDILEICHFVTMIKISPEIVNSLAITEDEKNFGKKLSSHIPLTCLIALWQILLKGIEELKLSTFPKKSAEMLIVRIIWANEISNITMLKKSLESENKNDSILTKHNNTSDSLTDNKEDIVDTIKSIFPKAELIK